MFGIPLRQRAALRNDSVRGALRWLFFLGPLLSTLPHAAIADEFKLSESQRISCTRGHRSRKTQNGHLSIIRLCFQRQDNRIF